MLGGVRTLLLHQETYIWPTPVTIPFVVPSVTVTLGNVPLMFEGSYTLAVALEGQYAPAVALEGNSQ